MTDVTEPLPWQYSGARQLKIVLDFLNLASSTCETRFVYRQSGSLFHLFLFT